MSLARERIHEVIKKEAYRLFWERLRARIPGTADGDWYVAEKNIEKRSSVGIFWGKVRERAYCLWKARQAGNIPGSADDDWLSAERWAFFLYQHLLR